MRDAGREVALVAGVVALLPGDSCVEELLEKLLAL